MNKSRGFTQRNSFTAIRFILATLVLLSHSFPLSGRQELSLRGLNLGVLAVDGFFALSGYLITKSWHREPEALPFIVARALRICPALILAIFFSINITKLCDNFSSNPVKWIANGSVWTLSWEVFCYVAVLIFGLIGSWSKNGLPILYSTMLLLFIFNRGLEPSSSTTVIAPLLILFLGGALVNAIEDRVQWKIIGPVSLMGCLIIVSPIKEYYLHIFQKIPLIWGPKITDEFIVMLMYVIFLPFLVVWLGSKINKKFVILNDFSYGIYLFAWPCQQFVEHQLPNLSTLEFFTLSFVITFFFAFSSWNLIEKPLSKRKLQIINFIRKLLKRLSIYSKRKYFN
jgi:peptidoglycan/LPS O-acetylase OafA/YrhL